MLPDRRVHTTLPTPDPERLRTFYEETLGFVPFAQRPGAILYRAGDGSLFAISKAGARATGGHTQMAFTVPDIAAEVADLRGRGVVFLDYDVPKTEQGIGRVGAGRAAWFKDPDGNLIGVLEFDDAV
ncbi:MAG: VOC family protein [Candidatus Limnocylindrales bacterium]|nr:VOC family protein [Candidatus Limnocylindrales bacterium]